MTLASSVPTLANALVVPDTLTVARAHHTREIGRDTKAMSHGALLSHPPVPTLAHIIGDTLAMSRANIIRRCRTGHTTTINNSLGGTVRSLPSFDALATVGGKARAMR